MSLAFLLAKPTQFDAPFFRWMHANRPDLPFVVYYWKPVGDAGNTDTETGSALEWGFDLLQGYNWFQANPEEPDQFGEKLRQSEVRCVISNGWKAGFAPLIQSVVKAGIPLGLRIDSVVWEKPWYEMFMRRWWLRRAYKPFSHFFSSGTVCDGYLRAMGIKANRLKRWPYCIDVAFFAPTKQREMEGVTLKQRYRIDDRPIILGVCKWLPRENPMELLDAFIKLNDTGLQLVMVGDGEQRPVLEAKRAAHPHLTITFTGYVPYADLPGWYAVANVFVHPARYEPWGVSVHEAIAAGKRVVVSSRVGSGYDLLVEGKNGFMYPVGNTNRLAQCIAAALQLPENDVQMANEAILREWDYETVVEGLGIVENG